MPVAIYNGIVQPFTDDYSFGRFLRKIFNNESAEDEFNTIPRKSSAGQADTMSTKGRTR
jgi:hypothetical protein